jgi:hypothetical protein
MFKLMLCTHSVDAWTIGLSRLFSLLTWNNHFGNGLIMRFDYIVGALSYILYLHL